MLPPAAQDYEGIVILGSPRSGTTLLRMLVDAHPRICCPPETNLLGACSRFLHEESFGPGFSMGVLSGLSFSGYDDPAVLDRLREFAFGFFREIRDRAGKVRWAEKSAFDAFHLDAIERLCGASCRYVCVFRHGLDVVCSLKDFCDKTGAYIGELHEYVRRFSSPHEAFAHAWVDLNTRLSQFAENHADKAIAVKYEDVIADPEGQLVRIFEHLGERTDVAALLEGVFKRRVSVGLGDWKAYQKERITDESIGRWQALPRELAGRLGLIVNPTLERLGYDPIAPPGELDNELARRRVKLAFMTAAGRRAGDRSASDRSDGPRSSE
jgi:hypothetical protein